MRAEIKKQIRASLKSRPFLALAVSRAYRLLLALRANVGLSFRFRHAYIASDVRLIGVSRIQIGKNVAIGRGSWLNVNERTSGGIALSIADNTFIGIRNFFTVGRSIRVGEYCLTTANCSFIGSTHRYEDPMCAYMASGITPNAEIYVGANCFFGHGAQVLGNVCIGHGSVIGAGAVVREDVPPFSLVVGNPAKVIKRFDFSVKEWVAWPHESLTEGPSESAYIEHLRKQHGFVIQPISVAASSFGNIF